MQKFVLLSFNLFFAFASTGIRERNEFGDDEFLLEMVKVKTIKALGCIMSLCSLLGRSNMKGGYQSIKVWC